MRGNVVPSGPRRPACLVVLALAALAALALGAAGAPGLSGSAAGIYGFYRDSLSRQREIEALILALPDAARVEGHARVLTSEPHVAGTPENEKVARYIFDRFKEAGLETAMKTYRVYLGYVKSALLEQVEPEPKRLTNPEEGGSEDKDAADPRAALTWNAYSPSCDLTREVVYVNYARPEDFEALDRLGVQVKNRLVLARYFNGYRGGKAQEAEKRGAAGIIFYGDPMEDGYFRGDVYPHGPWGPDSHVQRGAVVYDYIVPGDPLTPPITDVIGVLRGSEQPDEMILLGNHHDAWVYGAVDPSSGTATMLELARVAGELKRRGFPPRRTLVFGNWDAEEWTLTGSTEWGEERRDDLARHGVVCLNVDSSCAGPNFQASAVPTLRRLISETLRDVPDPRSGADLYSATLAAAEKDGFKSTYNAPSVEKHARAVTYDILGSGSDYTVFFNHIGIPSLDAGFDGPYGVYHSALDNYFWMSRFGDPGFKYHTAMVRVWGLLAYRAANADILPFEESPYPADVKKYLDDLETGVRNGPPSARDAGGSGALPDPSDLRAALQEWEKAAADLDAKVAAALAGARGTPETLAQVNAMLMKTERALLSPAGIPKRPWFRHLIYAPLPSYAAETLPGLREAVQENDRPRARSQAKALAAALRARAATVRRAAAALTP
ncbi:MAG: hypothetical protein DMF52_11620 [Acidobacteria bacterium]|nr:MAG: hypothetical protein DMF52_11620 [Acidobacteriota bacterium]